MPKKPEVKLPSLDSLFSTQAERDDIRREKVHEIPIDGIDSFPHHPFQVKTDDEMQALIDSIKAIGIQTPVVVRPKSDGRYELVSGHRRKKACEIIELESLPCIIREMSDDEAIIAMVESNLQREVILPSEKAKSYKMRLDAMKRKAGRPSKNNVSPVGTNLRSDEELAQLSGDSRNQIHRYIRITELIPQLLDLVDNRKLALRPAVELSYLPIKHQQTLIEIIESEETVPSQKQAVQIRKLSEEQNFLKIKLQSILNESEIVRDKQFKISRDKINKFIPVGTSPQDIEDVIIKALEMWYRKK